MSRLLRLGLARHLTRHPWQLALAMLGIALGVAVVLAVDLANAGARRSFALSLEQVTGRATHRIIGGNAGVPEALYARLRLEWGLRAAAPVVSGYAVARQPPGRVYQVLGVDPLAEAPVRRHLQGPAAGGDLFRLMTGPNTALFPPDAGPEAEMVVRIGEREVRLRAVGRLQDPRLAGLLITDISTAQVLFDRIGRLSHIDLVLPDGATGERLAAAIRAQLPPDLRLERTAERNEAVLQLSAAFGLNLTAMSLLALVVGMFLIYNTMTFVVVQRRSLLGTLRAIGVTRGEIFAAVLAEALLLGVAGTLLGGLLGIWLGTALVQLVTGTISDLYHVLNVRSFALEPLALIKAGVLGLVATVAAAWLPAREAAGVAPRAALSRAHLEARWRAALPRLSLAGVALLAAALAGFALTRGLVTGFAAQFALLLGCALLVPGGMVLLEWAAQPLTRRSGLLVRMAVRDLGRHLSRTGVAVAALMVAFAATVGVGVMVDSFRGGVSLWIQELVNADIYVAPPNLEDGDHTTPLRPEVVAALRATPGVGGLSLYRRSTVDVGGRPVQLNAVELSAAAQAGYRLLEAVAAPWQALTTGEAVIVSEPLAYRQGLHAGMTLALPTVRGPRDFLIAGVFLDYGSEHGRILIDRDVYRRGWDDAAVGSAAVYAAPGVEPAELRRRLETRLGPLQNLILRSNRDIQRFTLEVFDRTFTITGVLRLLAVLVAFVGVLSALLALQLERAREYAVLRATGMTAGEIGWLVSLQTGLLGLVAGLLALPVGLALAASLIFVINRRAFGWSLPWQVDPWILVQAVGLAVLAALLAGIYPIWRTARSRPADALRSD